MKLATFTTEQLQAANAAFQSHTQGRCEKDCSFCEDLRNSVLASHKEELKRIKRRKKRLKKR